uniref:SCAN domain-containing protein 1 n=1 Tax=Myotis lucifugus TaxID=59463 RepID=G1QAJ9_MYOLU
MATTLGSVTQASLNLGTVFQEYDKDTEFFRQRFRQYRSSEAARPRDVFNKLLELCSEWLKPKMRSKEQMVKLLTLEQYLTIMPQELETWVTEQCPESTQRILSLLEEIQMKPETTETKIDSHKKLLEDPAVVGIADMIPNIHLEVPPFQAMGTVPEAPLEDMWIPQELCYGAAGEEDLPFLETPEYPPPKLAPEEPCRQELQDCKELEDLDFFDFDLGNLHFDIGRENVSKWKKLESVYLFSVSSDGNVLLDPNFQDDFDELRYVMGNPAEQLLRDHTLPLYDQNPYPGESAESSNQEKPLNPRDYAQNSAPKKLHQCIQCGKDFLSIKVFKGHLKTSSSQGVSTCPECKLRFCNRKQFMQH